MVLTREAWLLAAWRFIFAVMPGPVLRLLLRAWLATAVVDGLFASALNRFAYGSTVTRVWQRVASTLLGPAAMDGGWRTAAIGLAMHVGVALAWSTVFLALLAASARLRRTVATRGGVLAVAAVYGPLIWIVMSFVIVPAFTARAPTITIRWWVQLLGHIPFVALPIVAMTTWGGAAERTRAPRPAHAPGHARAE